MKIIAEETLLNSNCIEIVHLDSKDEKYIKIGEDYLKTEVKIDELLQCGFVFVPGKIISECEEDEVGDRSFKINNEVLHFNESIYKIFVNKDYFKFCSIHHKMGDEYVIKMGIRVSPELAMQPNTETLFVVMDRAAYTNFQTKIF